MAQREAPLILNTPVMTPCFNVGSAAKYLSTGSCIQSVFFFLLAAAWVGPGRSALQSAEQWCKRRYGRIHQVGKMSFCDKNMHKGHLKQHTKAVSNPLWWCLLTCGCCYLCSRPPWTASSYWPLPPATASLCHPEPPPGPSKMGGQLGNHPPCVATGADHRGPVGRKPHLQSIRIANTANPVSKSGARSRWFQFLGW